METIENLTPEQSLEIIKRSMEQSRKDAMQHAGTPMIIWGCLACFTALIISYLWNHAGGSIWNLLWFVMAFVGYLIEKTMRNRHKPTPTGFIPQTLGYIWCAFAIFALAQPFLSAFFYIVICKYYTPSTVTLTMYPITFLIVLMLGLCATISGFILKSKIIIWSSVTGSFLGAILSIICTGGYQLLTVAITAVICLIFPGVIINMRNKE